MKIYILKLTIIIFFYNKLTHFFFNRKMLVKNFITKVQLKYYYYLRKLF